MTRCAKGDADAIAFGRWFTSNPDLPERFRHGIGLTPYVRDAFWGGDEKAYIDFVRQRTATQLSIDLLRHVAPINRI